MTQGTGRLKTRVRRLYVYSANILRFFAGYGLYMFSGRRFVRGNIHGYCAFRVGRNRFKFGMTTRFEQAYLEWYGGEIYTGEGEIVDLGAWLGSTALSIAVGLERNRHEKARNRRVHTYDLFVWEPWMDPIVAGSELDGQFQPGESFFDEFRQRTAPLAHRIEPHIGDLCQIGWNGRPIEFLMVDAMKSWELAEAILRDFYSRLVPGRGIIFHQDFAHYYTYWIHLIQYRLRAHFELVYDVPEGAAAVFRLVSCIPAEALLHASDPRTYTLSEIEAAFAYSRELVVSSKRSLIDAAHITCLAEYGRLEEAQAVMRRVRSATATAEKELKNAEAVVRRQMMAAAVAH